MEKGLAVITGANGGIGLEITRAVAQKGYRVIMACHNIEKASAARDNLIRETNNPAIEVIPIDLASLASVSRFAGELLNRGLPIRLLMNNAGTIGTSRSMTGDGLERTVSVNYAGHYLLIRKLLPLMGAGSRIVNMVSCTYPIGRIDFPHFFTQGRRGAFQRLLVYSNTKLALLLFSLELAERVREQGITVNAVDPGIVSTDMITMQQWFDPLADLFFRPFIRTPRQGAAGAVRVLLDKEYETICGALCTGRKIKTLSPKYHRHPLCQKLWEETEKIVSPFL